MGRAPWWLALAVYGPLALLGAGIAQHRRGAILRAPEAERFAEQPATALIVGLVLSGAVVMTTLFSTRVLVARTRWARALYGRLRAALLGASARRLALLAVAAAVAEELFFRAALVPEVGIWASSLAFGALHYSGRETYLAWMLWASAMGAVFAVLFLGSGSLLPPLVAHALINYENMRYLCREPAAER